VTGFFAGSIDRITGPEKPWLQLIGAVLFLLIALTALFFWVKDKFFAPTKPKDGEDH
jgi:hypothetical protein